ncbi:hypothetical protein CEY16_08905 [Halalkalibacillus sediminis]|uniref:Glutaredoxin family protein n=1 Tax=Halalkalibacillus sediminis TaxID=2018042 RepID=A0A2I0QUP3_9BACI|nr:glutaredoxin family protein [Halalkalibacillus sediminis]PKR78028.1 hypothetical protein CEY16_08905 [Halalkalibacillus sediminis]
MTDRLTVYFYTKAKCKLCDESKELLQMLQKVYHFNIIEQNIYQNERLLDEYHLSIPVVRIDQDELTAEDMDIVTMEDFITKRLH